MPISATGISASNAIRAPRAAAPGCARSGAQSSARSFAQLPARGFTLIELLVVLVIVGMISAGIVLSLGSVDEDAQLNDERERMSALFDYARERGSLATTEYGLQVAQHSYQFCYFDSLTGKWQVELLDEQLRPRLLPPGLEARLDVEGRKVVLKAELPDVDSHDKLVDFTPQILLYSNGDTNDFALAIRRPDRDHPERGRQFSVRSKGAGEVEFGKTVAAEP